MALGCGHLSNGHLNDQQWRVSPAQRVIPYLCMNVNRVREQLSPKFPFSSNTLFLSANSGGKMRLTKDARPEASRLSVV